ncbi:MAG: serine/threonine-protein kinase [Planctomycetota bacterium]
MKNRLVEVGKLGSGGFGEVCIVVRDRDPEQRFARKTLKTAGLSPQESEEASARFKREVLILASLDHPNIVPVLGRRLKNAPLYYLMPVYERSLRSEIAAICGDIKRTRRIFDQVLDALAYAHSQNIIHRDLKPENVLLQGSDQVVVSDFGLGRIIDAESTRQTQTGFPMGTPYYMAPEQLADAKSADHRCDVFALGRLLYELLGGNVMAPIQSFRNLPSGFETLIKKCTSEEPDERFSSVSDLKRAWKSIFDIGIRRDEKGEGEDLSKELAVGNSSPEHVERWLDLLASHRDDPDWIHQCLMQVNPNNFAGLPSPQLDQLRDITATAGEYVKEVGWPFDYTDKIAIQYKQFAKNVDDGELTATLIDALIEVGASHNRFFVMQTVGELLQICCDPECVLMMESSLTQTSKMRRQKIAPYINMAAIDPKLQTHFSDG